MTEKRLFRWGDAIPALCCVILAAVLFAARFLNGAGEYVLVQTPDGEQRLSLSEQTEQVFVGKDGLTVTVAVQHGGVQVVCADCPDQVCVHTGRIRQSGRAIACLPAGIVITVLSDHDDAPDAVAR